MGKKILIYTGDNSYHAIFERMTEEIANGFISCGYDVQIAKYEEMKSLYRAYDALKNNEIDLSFGFNCIGVNIDYQGQYIYEKSELLHFSYMLDAPYNPTIGRADWPCKNQIFTFLDKTHPAMLKLLCPEKAEKKTMFLPMAGITNLTEDEIFSRKRKNDVVICANFFGEYAPERVWRQYSLNSELLKILEESADLLEACPISIYQAVQHILAINQYGEENIKVVFPYFTDLFNYIKMKRRLNSVEILLNNDIRPIVYGKGWERVPFADKLELRGTVSFEEMLAAFSQSKIVYQDMAEFNNGANDRGFHAMLNGAAVVSEYSSYLEEEYKDGEEIFFYDWQNGKQQVSAVNELLENESLREKACRAAYKITNERHCWSNRAREILAAAEEYYSRDK